MHICLPGQRAKTALGPLLRGWQCYMSATLPVIPTAHVQPCRPRASIDEHFRKFWQPMQQGSRSASCPKIDHTVAILANSLSCKCSSVLHSIMCQFHTNSRQLVELANK